MAVSWRVVGGLGVVLAGLVLAAWFGARLWPAVSAGRLFFNDSAAQWSFARFAMEHGAAGLYDAARLDGFQRALYPALRQSFPFPYPPHYLFFVAPLAWLDGPWVWPVWSAAGLLLFVMAAGRSWERAVLALAPACVVGVAYGQNGLLVGALLVGAVRVLPRSQLWAGVLFGLATIKPQLGLLVPVALVAAGQWRAIGAAWVTVMAAVVASGLVFGWGAWGGFVDSLSGHAAAIDAAVNPRHKATVAAVLEQFGVGRGLGYAVQGVVALGVAGLVWGVWRRGVTEAAGAVLLVAGFLATPYAFQYDLPAVAAAGVMLARGALPWPAVVGVGMGMGFPLVAAMTSRFFWVAPVGLVALLVVGVWKARRPDS